MFDGFLEQLNGGLLLRDSNNFTTFSKNNELIIKFYSNFLQNESINHKQDL